MTNIFFSGSITAGRNDAPLYRDLIVHLRKHGTVLTEYVGDLMLTARDGTGNVNDTYANLRKLLHASDVQVAEVTTPSIGVGYEIDNHVMRGKPVLCLHRLPPEKRLTAVISGNPGVVAKHYHTVPEAMALIDEFFANLSTNGV